MSECYVCGQVFTAASVTREQVKVPLCVGCTPAPKTRLPPDTTIIDLTRKLPLQVDVKYYRVWSRRNDDPDSKEVEVTPCVIGAPGYTAAEILDVLFDPKTIGNPFPDWAMNVPTRLKYLVRWELVR